MKRVLQALSSIDIGSLICNVGAGGGAPAGAVAAGAPAAGGDAPGTFVSDLCFLLKGSSDKLGQNLVAITCLTFYLVLPTAKAEEKKEEKKEESEESDDDMGFGLFD